MSRDPRKDRARKRRLRRREQDRECRRAKSPKFEYDAALQLLLRRPHSLWSGIAAALSEMHDY